MSAKSQMRNRERKRTEKGRPCQQSPDGPALAAMLVDPAVVQQTLAHPEGASPTGILALQRMAGNRAVSSLIQAKLRVGPVGDCYEQEADRVADQVLSMSEPAQQQAVRRQEEEELQMKPLAATISQLVQRQEEEELQMKSLVQRQDEKELQMEPLHSQEEDEELQAKPLVQRLEEEDLRLSPVATQQVVQRQAGGGFVAGPELESRLEAQRGGGRPLPEATRAFMEPRFGADFSGVRVHTGGEAVQLTRDLKAQALTRGQDIFLGQGRYPPGTSDGRRLLAHELTHTIQQTGADTLKRRHVPEKVRIQGSLPADRVNLKAVDMYVDFVKMKRKEIKWGKILLPKKLWSKEKAASDEGLYGHWWTEVGRLDVSDWNPDESYGWYPRKGVTRWQTLKGVKGALNAEGPDSQRDPDQGKPADTEFHPVMRVDDQEDYDQIRDRILGEIRAFAKGYKGKWSWKLVGRGKNCHTFQKELMSKVGMKKKKAKSWVRDLKNRDRQIHGEEMLMLHKKVGGKPFGKVSVREFESKTWKWRGDEEGWTRAEYKGREVFVDAEAFDRFVNAWTLYQGGEVEE